jgi:rRNA processing protein Gar1
MTTPDPVSWLLVEPGWTVVDAEGSKVGKVDEVLGDEQTDIFHGLVVDGREILAENVAEIREGEIRLTSRAS